MKKYYLIYLGITFTAVLKEKKNSIKRKIKNCYSLYTKLLHTVILQDCNSPLCSGPQYMMYIPAFLKVNLNASIMMPHF